MPKVDLRTQYRKQTDEWAATMRSAMAYKGLTQRRTAEKMQMDRSQLCRKLKDIDKMTVGELRAFASVTGIKIDIRGEKQ